MESNIRVGIGFDVHRLVKGRKLILAGLEIDFPKGLLGHSDADVIAHSVMSAILGAMAQGSLGDHFPDTDPEYKDARSIDLLERVRILMEEQGYSVGNIDVMIICESPKLAPYISQMQMNLSEALRVPIDRISIKATTSEGLGFIGRGDGIACQAVSLLIRQPEVTGEPRGRHLWKKRIAEDDDASREYPKLPEEKPEGVSECIVYVDGASDGNPGPSGIGAIFEVPGRGIIGCISEVIGEATNNEAEYKAAIRAAEICRNWGIKKLVMMTDSQLMVKQVNGSYKVKNQRILNLYNSLMLILSSFTDWRIEYISRDENEKADRLSRLALKKVKR